MNKNEKYIMKRAILTAVFMAAALMLGSCRKKSDILPEIDLWESL